MVALIFISICDIIVLTLIQHENENGESKIADWREEYNV